MDDDGRYVLAMGSEVMRCLGIGGAAPTPLSGRVSAMAIGRGGTSRLLMDGEDSGLS